MYFFLSTSNLGIIKENEKEGDRYVERDKRDHQSQIPSFFG